jgi:ribosomal protein L4
VFAEPSTKQAVAFLAGWSPDRPLLVVATAEEENVVKSFRNLARVQVVEPGELEVAALAWARSLLVTEAALPFVEARAAGEKERQSSEPTARSDGRQKVRP